MDVGVRHLCAQGCMKGWKGGRMRGRKGGGGGGALAFPENSSTNLSTMGRKVNVFKHRKDS